MIRARQFATKEETERAREVYCLGSDADIEIDEHPVISVGEEGMWVQAWVWLPNAGGNRRA